MGSWRDGSESTSGASARLSMWHWSRTGASLACGSASRSLMSSLGLPRRSHPSSQLTARDQAPHPDTHRPEEKVLRDAVCGIRWTPASAKLGGNPYYEWIVEGRRLYDALD